MCISSSSLAVIKSPDLSNLRGKGLVWLTIPGGIPTMNAKAQQPVEKARHESSLSQKQDIG